MIKCLLLFAILAGCGKDCLIETSVVVGFQCENTELLQSVQINFYQGERVIRADIVHEPQFKNGVFYLEYLFYDTDPDFMIWRVYAIDRTFIEYKTEIK